MLLENYFQLLKTLVYACIILQKKSGHDLGAIKLRRASFCSQSHFLSKAHTVEKLVAKASSSEFDGTGTFTSPYMYMYQSFVCNHKVHDGVFR